MDSPGKGKSRGAIEPPPLQSISNTSSDRRSPFNQFPESFMDHVQSLKCLVCGAEYGPDQIDYVCPLHGDDGIVDVQYRYEYRLRARPRRRWPTIATTRSGATNRCCRSNRIARCRR